MNPIEDRSKRPDIPHSEDEDSLQHSSTGNRDVGTVAVERKFQRTDAGKERSSGRTILGKKGPNSTSTDPTFSVPSRMRYAREDETDSDTPTAMRNRGSPFDRKRGMSRE
jgi:hypothetical protein